MKINFIFRNYIPAVLWSVIIFIVCLLPGNTFPAEDFLDTIYFDKIVHFTMYLILFMLIMNGIKKERPIRKKLLFAAAFICILQGVLIEFLQGSDLVSNRSFELFDIIANITGVLTGFLLALRKHKTI